jgi:hypothetical protein
MVRTTGYILGRHARLNAVAATLIGSTVSVRMTGLSFFVLDPITWCRYDDARLPFSTRAWRCSVLEIQRVVLPSQIPKAELSKLDMLLLQITAVVINPSI